MYPEYVSPKNKRKPGIRSFLHRRSILLKVLLSYIIIGAILISALSTLLFKKFSESSLEDIKSISEKSLEQSYRVISTLWESTYTYMYKEYTTNAALANAMYSQEYTPEVTGEIFKRISEIVNNNDIIDSIYIYNSKADCVFSSIGPYTSSGDFYDSDIISYIKNTQKSDIREFSMLYRTMKLKYQSSAAPRNVISVIFRSDEESAVVFNLNLNMIQKTIGYGKADPSNRVMIVSKEGIVISHPELSMVFSSVKGKDFFKKITANEAESGYYDEATDGHKNLILYKRWDFLGWYFVIVDDYDNLLFKVRGLQRNVIITTLVFILLSIMIAALFIGNIYKPFYRLLGKIKAQNPNANVRSLNEYDYLENAYNMMNNHIVSLSEYKTESRMAFRKELLNRIIRGKQGAAEEVRKQTNELGLNLSGDRFLAVVLKIDDVKEKLKRYTKEDMDLYRYALSNIAGELFSAKFNVETDDSCEDSVTVIMSNFEEDNSVISDIKAILPEIQSAAEKYLDLSITAGIGTMEDGLLGIPLSYDNALTASNYRLIYGKKAIIDIEDVAVNVQMDYEYPLELEKDITDALRAADEVRIGKCLNNFIQHVSRFGYDEIRLALDQILLVSLRVSRNIILQSGMSEIGISFSYPDIQKDFKAFDTLKETENWLLDYYLRVIDICRRNRENKYEDIVLNTVTYIKENFQNPDLSVETIADLVNLSPNYLRTLFKDSIGKSMSRYITDLRFDKAREYLTETDLAANKIGEMVGFQKSGYFYTAFKKATGVSPDEYRRIYKVNNSN